MLPALNRDGLSRIATRMDRYVDNGYLAGYVLSLGVGDDIWLHHHGVQDLDTGVPMAPDSIFRIASMSKAILAAAAMLLVDEGALDLDAPVERLLPEMADRRVLRTLSSDLDDTVPAKRPITTRHLLTLTWGLGALFNGLEETPLAQAMVDRGVGVGPFLPDLSPDEYMAAIGSLPLAFQPGEGWLYHSGFDVLPILLERLTGTTLDAWLRTNLFDPLDMTDTGFAVPDASLSRFTTDYAEEDGRLTVFDPAQGGRWHHTRGLQGEFVSTARDFNVFARMLLNNGMGPNGQLLSAAAVAEMTTDHLTSTIKTEYPFFPGFWADHGWGYGVGIQTAPPAAPGLAEGTYGWSGGFNTHWQTDPSRDLVGIFLAQRNLGSPDDAAMIDEFWALTAEALPTLAGKQGLPAEN